MNDQLTTTVRPASTSDHEEQIALLIASARAGGMTDVASSHAAQVIRFALAIRDGAPDLRRASMRHRISMQRRELRHLNAVVRRQQHAISNLIASRDSSERLLLSTIKLMDDRSMTTRQRVILWLSTGWRWRLRCALTSATAARLDAAYHRGRSDERRLHTTS